MIRQIPSRRKRVGVVQIRSGTPVRKPTQTTPQHWATGGEKELRDQLLRACSNEQIVGVPLVAIIVPVLQRPGRVRPLHDSFRATTSWDDARMYFVAQRSDTEERRAIEAVGIDPILVEDTDRSWAKKINQGYLHTVEPWLLLGADDLCFRPGWIDVVRARLMTHPGVIGTNDLGNPSTIAGTHSTHPLVRRRYATICGTADERCRVVHDGYDHNFPDTELVATAKRRDLWIHASDCVIEHLHPAWGKAKSDPIYALGQRRMEQDRALFVQRGKVFGW